MANNYRKRASNLRKELRKREDFYEGLYTKTHRELYWHIAQTFGIVAVMVRRRFNLPREKVPGVIVIDNKQLDKTVKHIVEQVTLKPIKILEKR
jgi:hypothetical protein